uniref:Uncharacterized protein n=1 Tax=Anguilla anguilla TaxID=7936 RepID=A0A0E9TTG9_ANGAN
MHSRNESSWSSQVTIVFIHLERVREGEKERAEKDSQRSDAL